MLINIKALPLLGLILIAEECINATKKSCSVWENCRLLNCILWLLNSCLDGQISPFSKNCESSISLSILLFDVCHHKMDSFLSKLQNHFLKSRHLNLCYWKVAIHVWTIIVGCMPQCRSSCKIYLLSITGCAGHGL